MGHPTGHFSDFPEDGIKWSPPPHPPFEKIPTID